MRGRAEVRLAVSSCLLKLKGLSGAIHLSLCFPTSLTFSMI